MHKKICSKNYFNLKLLPSYCLGTIYKQCGAKGKYTCGMALPQGAAF
nr:MAG TPA: hypothetical protein [Caudoviricetes sp.]